MTAVTATPPALRWVALFLAACAALGLFLGFRDQMRKNPPDWYTGAERLAAPLPSASDGIREAAPIDPNAPQATVTTNVTTEPAAKATTDETEDAADAAAPGSPPAAETPAGKTPPATPPAPAPKQKTAPTPAPKPAPPADPVGDILEGQKPAPADVPY